MEYAPWWVRVLSAVCLGVGTMIGYRRIVTTLGERLGNVHLTPAQGASAEVVSALLIGTAGFTGLPVSTTHIVTSGIGGTMVASGAGLRYGMISRIAIAWVLTLADHDPHCRRPLLHIDEPEVSKLKPHHGGGLG